MSDSNARVEQFRQQAEKNPTDPLGFFSLGRAYLEAGQFDPAVLALQRTLALDSKLSRAYQLLARAQLALGRRVEALASLREGLIVSHQRGDLMVKNELLAMFAELNETPPEIDAPVPADLGANQVLDRRTGRPGTRLSRPPFRTALGRLIFENVSAESWKEWIAQGTKVINELRLPMHDPAAQKVYDRHMIEFLNLQDLIEK
jgi:Fe-S cluster biosynthesis and repair protein YggX